MGGLSTIDRPGLIFYLPEANEALFDTLQKGFRGTRVEVIRDERHPVRPGVRRSRRRADGCNDDGITQKVTNPGRLPRH